ncbi:MAG: endolytic transglycosylase MltG [Bacteroidota bacterium]|nr:endolytic transglycosylase MltG [Bacteroidota bacterium]
MSYYLSKYGNKNKRTKKPHSKGYVIIRTIILLLLVIGGVYAYKIYTTLFDLNTWSPDNKSVSLFIKKGESFDEIKKDLYSRGIIKNRKTFEWLSLKKDYANNIKPGHYIITPDMTNNQLINTLRAGLQTPVNVIFNNIRTLEGLSTRITSQLEFDTAAFNNKMHDSVYINKLGFTKENIKTLFIPNTYEFYWTVSIEDFLTRMLSEYKKFWTEERISKAKMQNMTREEVIILASIVEKETAKNDEKTKVAGVYINRLKKGWKLQADPTLIYALKDFSIHRVLNKHKKVDSPYNTYKYNGLPPGPICFPSISSIDAVLNYKNHEYLYFCAKADFSGYHTFGKNYWQHVKNAKEYQKALNEQKIWN